MDTYIPVTDPVTAQWLTVVLRQSGILTQGEVRQVEKESTGAFNSHTSHLFLLYSADAPVKAPKRLIIKRNLQEDWGKEAGRIEVKFYNLVATLPNYPPVIITCYGAAYDESTGSSYVLLEDLSETHQPPITRDQQISIVEGVPPTVYIEAVVNTLAQIHSYWWNHSLLEATEFDVGYWSRNTERFEAYHRRRRNSWQYLISNEHSWFPRELREMYEQVLTHLPRFWEQYLEPRFRENKNLTLVHGDAYFANFLCPKNPKNGVTYLLDWQEPSFDIGGYDLANLCAAYWTPDQRHEQQREEKMLRLYHKVLQENGVKNYSWDELLTDYQIGLIFWLLMPVQDCFGGAGKDYWWPKMQCLVAAFQDWHCQQLLDI